MIPKKIYQTWYTKEIPEKIKSVIDNMKRLNPSYEYQLFDDDDIHSFIKDNYGRQTLLSFEQLSIGAAKADLWRYLVLYKNGGIYLDLDSAIYSNLDSLIKEEDEAIISREKNYGLFVQWCLMFNKEHPILEKTIERCIFNIKTRKTENILQLTGPHVFSDSINDVLKPLEVDVYSSSDADIDRLMNNNKKYNKIKTRIFSFDYNGYCCFKSDDSYLLNINRLDWRQESKIKSVFNH